MSANKRDFGLPQQSDQIADKYQAVEPSGLDANSPTPISLTWEERGGAGEPITVATEPISVLIWVRYPNISTHVDGHALAWTRRAVYVEWQNRGVHRMWVWASAVDRL